jgi:hypothetical protein
MKPKEALLLAMALAVLAAAAGDFFYISRFQPRFKEIEKERIITSNQLATAKIVSENLKHVRELIFRNMDFPGQKDSISQQSAIFDFLTDYVNDLKMRLVTVRPLPPTVLGRVTTYGYEIELEGDFFSFGELCSKLENSQRVLAITSFDVSRAKADEVAEIRSAKSAPLPASHRGVLIKLHLDTFRVRKG